MAENGKAKYYALMEEMKTDILSGKIRPGEKLPSENQLSVRYGLSRHTVRKALGILAGDGYIESFQGKGTFCADVLRQIHGTGNIAVVTTYISDYIFPRLIQGIDEVLSDNGYSIILKNTGNSRQKEARFLEELISKGIVQTCKPVRNTGQVSDPLYFYPGTVYGDAGKAPHPHG